MKYDKPPLSIDEQINLRASRGMVIPDRARVEGVSMISGLKPYPVMKDPGAPWLGEVPEHWKLERAKRLFRKMNRPIRPIDEVVTCFRDGTVTLRKNRRVRGFTESLKEIGYQGIRRGDLVIHAMDAFAGAIGVADSDGKGSPVYLVCKATSGVDAHYYAYITREMARSQWILALAKGIRERSTDFRFENFGCQFVPAPPMQEQTAIVRFLGHYDRKIRRYVRAKQKLIKLLEEQKQAIIYHAVTRGLNPNVRLKSTGVESLGSIPEHWVLARLKDAGVVQTGLTLGKQYQRTATESFPYLRVANVQHGRVELKHVKHIDIPPSEAVGATLQAGDVLMTEGGDIDKLGRGCVWRNEIPGCLHQNHVFAVRCRQDILAPDFLVSLMTSQHGRTYFQLTAKQTTNLASTNSTTLRAFPVILPPVAEQKAILAEVANQTAALDAAMVRAETEISLLQEYRTRLIADVVTGKLDVREAAAQLPDEAGDQELLDEAELPADNEEGVEDFDDVVASEEAVEP
ncbi:MAG: Type-1 restriction enzyme EcoKI specificity protein [Syntrophorhabdus sp. PtaB.Bin006]|nr:MAG: Type-1 restriction enzyme EcoKI specificity protein [Syntrophorhabdus sp. PtaB.Bin006]OPY85299.1 MAG: Type-1 restriction enzyme EcoKI specificity protein [Syntrophorhabdus sp. PtaU1.Bin153]